MSLQKCTGINEAVPLEVGLGLYLKLASKIKISVQLPKLKAPGQSISTWQVMEKLRSTVRPDQFLSLKALKITSTVIKFLGELDTHAASERALARLQAVGGIKLSGFSEWLQIRGAHAACVGPTRHDWDSFFRDARGVDEMKPGERPDTIYLQDLPSSWFSESTKSIKPSERLLHKAFSTFGRIRRLEIPSNSVCTEEQTFRKTNSLYKDLTFQVYIQYEEYVEFATAMDSLRGKKLLHKDLVDGKVYSAEIKVDFDRTNYLSDRNIQKRASEARKLSTPFVPGDTENSNSKCPEAEPALPPGPHPSEEARLLLGDLLRRAEASERENAEEKSLERGKKKHSRLLHQEELLKQKLVRSFRAKEQERTVQLREKLRKELSGRKLLSVLANHRTADPKRTKKPS